MTCRRILLVAGGTGGHILPAVAFGKWIADNRPDAQIAYISGSRALEAEIYAAEGVMPTAIRLSGSPLGAPRGQRLSRWKEMLCALPQTGKRIAEFSPDLVMLFGGYVGIPALLCCKRRRIRTVAHEQNAFAGRMVRLAARMQVPVASGWRNCRPLPKEKYIHTGTPIRFLRDIDRTRAADELGLTAFLRDGPNVLVTTGSLGSARVQEIVGEVAALEAFSGWNFIVVSGEAATPVKVAANLFHIPKRWDIAPVMAIADLLVVRAGASTLSEAMASDIPTIVIPWAGAAGDHQMLNAGELEEDPRFRIWRESAETIGDLAAKIKDLRISYPVKAGNIGKRMYNVADNICGVLWDMASGHKKGEIDVEGR